MVILMWFAFLQGISLYGFCCRCMKVWHRLCSKHCHLSALVFASNSWDKVKVCSEYPDQASDKMWTQILQFDLAVWPGYRRSQIFPRDICALCTKAESTVHSLCTLKVRIRLEYGYMDRPKTKSGSSWALHCVIPLPQALRKFRTTGMLTGFS